MTRKLFLSYLFVTTAALAQQVTGITFDNLSHSDLRIIFTSNGWTGSNAAVRLRYTVAPASCTGGTGGTVQGNQQISISTYTEIVLAGLSPATTYNACAEITNDRNTWTSSGQSASFTTLPLPAIHPAPPVAPTTFNTDYPDTTGFTQVTVASDCHDYQSDLNTAINNQINNGTVINIPPGTVCAGTFRTWDTVSPDVIRFNSSAVSTTNSSITIPNHGMTEGQKIRFGSNYGCLPGSISPSSGYCGYQGPIVKGQAYYAHILDQNTIQIYNNGGAGSSGTLIAFADAGAGNLQVVKLPRPLHQIVVRTATPDNQFDPQHVRVNPAWGPKMGIFELPLSNLGNSSQNVIHSIDNLDPTGMTYGIRFVGLEFTYAPNPFAFTSADPNPWNEFFSVWPAAEHIIFDRCWFHGLGTPNRVQQAFWWNGYESAMLDNYIDNLEYFHSAYTGLNLTQTSPTSFTIAPGSMYFGAGQGSITSTATVNVAGSQGGQNRGYVYFTMTGNQLNIVLPPGLTGTATGANNVRVVTASSQGTFVYASPSGSTSPGSSSGNANAYFIDPIFSADGTQANSYSLFSDANLLNNVPSYAASGYTASIGTRFYSDANGFILGVRFPKVAGDSAATHTGYLWDNNGNQLATGTFSNETASGWQTLLFAAPVQITANNVYLISANVGGNYYFDAFTQNKPYDNRQLHAPATSVASNGSGNYSDSWPKDVQGRPAAGYVGFVDISTAGTLVNVGNVFAQQSQFLTEGCQCMQGGMGPGPYIFQDNYLSAVGLPWHHDDSGGNWATVGDYTYNRNYFHAPISRKWKDPQSDGMEYFHRQLLEWKKGLRINLVGNIFDTSWVEDNPASVFIAMTPRLINESIGEVEIKYNTFRHGPGILTAPGVADTISNEAPPGGHYRFENNLAWDISPNYCITSGANCAGAANGWYSEAPTGGEDYVTDHNSLIGMSGRVPSIFHLFDTKIEGIQMTNNFMSLSGGNFGITLDYIPDDPCRQGTPAGEAMAACKLPGYVWDHNVMIGNGISAGQLQAAWPNHVASNYFPSDTNLGDIGWFRCTGPNCLGSTTPDFHLKSGFCSGCGSVNNLAGSGPANDLRDVGADIDALEAAQGKVTLIGVPELSLTSTSAAVSFVAPDQAGCTVDYGSSDPTLINSFTRASDAGGGRVRNVTLNGLASKTVYHYRVNCAVEQPTGQFRTK